MTDLLIFFNTDAIFCGLSLYSQSSELSSMLRWVTLLSASSLHMESVTFDTARIRYFYKVLMLRRVGAGAFALGRPSFWLE